MNSGTNHEIHRIVKMLSGSIRFASPLLIINCTQKYFRSYGQFIA